MLQEFQILAYKAKVVGRVAIAYIQVDETDINTH